ncbi:MAG: O-antigen ligase family protein, partial [Pseudomonadota bacterium]
MLFLILAFVFHLAVLKGRAGYLVFAILSPLVANNLMNRFSLKFKTMVSIILVGSIFLSPVVRTVIQDTFTNVSEHKEKILAGEDIDIIERPFIIRETIRSIQAHPLMGTGTGSLSVPTMAKGHRVDHAHNNLLYMWSSFGILGLVSCFWLFWKMFALSWKSRDTAMGYFVFSTCSVLFLGGMFDTMILNTGTLLFLT